MSSKKLRKSCHKVLAKTIFLSYSVGMCDRCSKAKTLDDIGLMLEEDRYEFARDTLEGIATWVCQNDHVTPGQLNAIRNIRLSVIAAQKREIAGSLKKG